MRRLSITRGKRRDVTTVQLASDAELLNRMNRWWWLVLIIQVTSCKVLAQGESTTAASGDCQESDCKSGPLWTPEEEKEEESPIDGQQVVKRQPLLSRWGSQRLSDLFYFDYKRRPAFSSWGGKRGPAFSSWGGKRSVRNTQTNQSAWTQHSPPEDLTTIPHYTTIENLDPINNDWNDIEARKLHLYSFPQKIPLTPFPGSWVPRGVRLFDSGEPGKESYLEYTPFKESTINSQSDIRYGLDSLNQQSDTLSNFDGKRAAAFNSWGGKRVPAFNSWGGKRAAAFNSWGGKRTLSLEDLDEDKRAAAFNSWGGKRSSDLNDLGGEKRAAAFNSWGGKRAAAFNSWGGKRAAAFNSWGGKRAAAFNSWGGKRAAAFNSWGGKRLAETEDLADDKRTAAFSSWGGKKVPAFNSWGGKRAAAFNRWGGKRLAEKYDLADDKRTAAVSSWGGKKVPAFNSWGGKRAAAFNSWVGKRLAETEDLADDKRTAAFSSGGGKRVPAFNSWGGKRAAAFNSWGGKREAAFNSWGGKRAAAFNSWGGKRAAAFNSWGGKRLAEMYDLGDDKRTAAFSSWGGKRVPAFNSWGGKRAAAFNSWGGKRTNTAFSSWGGKRDAAFNSWGGKRTPAFNSWGGKRSELIVEGDLDPQNLDNNDKNSKSFGNFTQKSVIDTTDQTTKLPQESNPLEKILSTYDDGMLRSDGKNDNDDGDNKDDSSIREKRTRMTIRAGKRKPRFYSWGGRKRSESETEEYNDEDPSNMSPDEDSYGYESLEPVQDENEVENNSMLEKIVMDKKNIKKRIDELYTTHSRSGFSGKRKPAFSSWGGKRSESDGSNDEDKIENTRKKRSIKDEDLSNEIWGVDSNDVIDNSLFPTNTVTCCVKKLQYDKNLFMQMLFRTNGFRDMSWPSNRPNRRGAEFYAWGGKRTTL
ncbi:hypothetical protein LSTR_LSTR009891 [Laodelphax striatellus]|uniref:Uncharacterized protein n=1 Tax=Laodelphax striatellus TaxID=195883 RepID=A0A482WK11_LAOST|nr:hypothetical protein LSTR_LSTR009891 [Laodelphax striatellus]